MQTLGQPHRLQMLLILVFRDVWQKIYDICQMSKPYVRCLDIAGFEGKLSFDNALLTEIKVIFLRMLPAQ